MRTRLNNFGRGPSEQETLNALLGEVEGLRILDAACAGGRLSAWLADKGAEVVGLDITATMLDAAKARLAGRGHVVQADLAELLPIRDEAFDVVLSAFTLHYLRDWAGPLREFHRVLRQTSAALVLSVHHPCNDLAFAGNATYFETAEASDSWVASDGTETTVHFYRRPLSAIIEALYEAGFVVERVLEAPPDYLMGEAAGSQKPHFVCLRAIKACV
jgi:ubiquinone/menaquinone biosynthesis C-methylase UbiE